LSDIDQLMSAAPVIPVLVIDRAEDAEPVARALVAGGLPVLEVTLRTPAALEAIAAMKSVEGAIVGAGTVLNPKQLEQAMAAGAEFAVSPGLTVSLGAAAASAGIPFLPGIANATQVMRALEQGYTRLKFFPAMASGGLPLLNSLSAVFSEVRFCPTGGITQQSAPEWLAHRAVACVGGSWLVPAGKAIDPGAIQARAEAASALSAKS
jgi:2-dehydro-3-deoxyphosphogluconate aldolase / (4S)-4-hydroxy-2-oxoglutarate aldolase